VERWFVLMIGYGEDHPVQRSCFGEDHTVQRVENHTVQRVW
jgi:hypothetical protein